MIKWWNGVAPDDPAWGTAGGFGTAGGVRAGDRDLVGPNGPLGGGLLDESVQTSAQLPSGQWWSRTGMEPAPGADMGHYYNDPTYGWLVDPDYAEQQTKANEDKIFGVMTPADIIRTGMTSFIGAGAQDLFGFGGPLSGLGEGGGLGPQDWGMEYGPGEVAARPDSYWSQTADAGPMNDAGPLQNLSAPDGMQQAFDGSAQSSYNMNAEQGLPGYDRSLIPQGNGIMDTLTKALKDKFQSDPFGTAMLGLGALGTVSSMVGGAKAKKDLAAREAQARQDRMDRQARFDNPGTGGFGFSSVAPLGRTSMADYANLNRYGRGPERSFFNNVNPVRARKGGLNEIKDVALSMRSPLESMAVKGPGGGQDDKIPAMLSDGEYIMDAETVSALGDGSTEAGAQTLDRLRENLRKHKRAASSKKIPPKAKSPESYMKGRS